jgi:hypothetical protein
MSNIVNINNVTTVEYTALMDLLHDIYAKDIPAVDLNTPVDVNEIENLMIWFSNNYAYITELWARMAHEVRLLKKTSINKDAIDAAMSSRDYLEKVMSAIKLKYYTSRTMLEYHGGRGSHG